MPSRANLPWTLEEEQRLYDETGNGLSEVEIAAAHARTIGAITSRQRQMGLRNEDGALISPLPEFRSYLRTNKTHRKEQPRREESHRDGASKGIRGPNSLLHGDKSTAQQIVWPQDFPWEGNWIEKLWCAFCHDMDVLLMDTHRPRAIIERKIQIARARLTPADDLYPSANLEQLGDRYHVTRERIRQIQIKVSRQLDAGIRRKNGLTVRTLENMLESVASKYDEAPLSWFAVELGRHGCRKEFCDFMLMTAFRLQGASAREARKRVNEAMAFILRLQRAETSRGQRENWDNTIPDNVKDANAFVRRFLEKMVWPERLNERLADLSQFRPLRECKYERPYYAKTLERLVHFDSLGERRLIRALDICTLVIEFAEQPVEIQYRLDGRDRIYIPDLLIRTDTDFFFVIEIKGRRQLADRETLAKAEAAEEWLGARGIGYCLADANGFGLDDLHALEPDDEFSRRLEKLLEANGMVRRRAFERVFAREQLPWAYDQLQSEVLRRGMSYETSLIPQTDGATRYIFDFNLRA